MPTARSPEGDEGAPRSDPAAPAATPWARLQRCGALVRSADGNLVGDGRYAFVTLRDDACIPRPVALPSVTHGNTIHFLVPTSVTLPARWETSVSPQLPRAIVAGGAASIQQDFTWPDAPDILAAIEEHETLVSHALTLREARNLLARERKREAALYGSLAETASDVPMLIEGLMRERGVSVIYGAFDEFKTTVVLDAMAHVAMGVAWQGRAVSQRPVIWYALDGADDIPLRLRVLESSLRGRDTSWGQDRAPFSVRQRIPGSALKWRAEICRIAERWEEVATARHAVGELPTESTAIDRLERPPVVVVDVLSMALGNEFEQGPRAPRFIQDCLDLLRERQDLAPPDDAERGEDRNRGRMELPATIDWPVASHVILIHQQTTARTEFDGPGVIFADTQGLYRVHRFGNVDDDARAMAGQLTPMRVKGMLRPAPLRFAVEVIPVEGTSQTAAILAEAEKSLDASKLSAASEEARDATVVRDTCASPMPEVPEDDLDRVTDVAGKRPTTKRNGRERPKGASQSARAAARQVGTAASEYLRDIGSD